MKEKDLERVTSYQKIPALRFEELRHIVDAPDNTSDFDQYLQRIREILALSQAVLAGHFLLKSVSHSLRLLQSWRVAAYYQFLDELAAYLKSLLKGREGSLVVSPMGPSIPFGLAFARILKCRFVACIERDNQWELHPSCEPFSRSNATVILDQLRGPEEISEIANFVVSQVGALNGIAAPFCTSPGGTVFLRRESTIKQLWALSYIQLEQYNSAGCYVCHLQPKLEIIDETALI